METVFRERMLKVEIGVSYLSSLQVAVMKFHQTALNYRPNKAGLKPFWKAHNNWSELN